MNPPDQPGAPEPPAPDPPAPGAPLSSTRSARFVESLAARFAPAGPVLRDLGTNLRAALALAMLRARLRQALRASGTQLLLLFLLDLLLGLTYDLYAVGWQAGHFDVLALPAVSFWTLSALFSAWLVGAICADASLFMTLATAGFSLAIWESVACAALAIAADLSPSIDRVYSALSWVPLVWVALAYALGATRIAAAPTRSRGLTIFVLSSLLVIAPQWAVDPANRLWTQDAGADQDVDTGPDAPQSEQTLYGQFDLLDDALNAIAPSQSGVTELFTISFGGDGTQDVFLSEAVGADSAMADAFDSSTRSLVLANSQTHPRERPFATVSALERSLAAVAERMNGDEDVLALFLTSHGTRDHHLVVSLPPYQFEDLTPERLRAMLDEAGIRYRVIIVSSCYSGGFIAPLAGPDTMVITASSADRTSFGCRDGAQWTDFGRAYFAEALAKTASFEGAFRIASQRIAERENQERVTPSLPQISVGEGIRDHLQRLQTRRSGRILFASQPGGGKIP